MTVGRTYPAQWGKATIDLAELARLRFKEKCAACLKLGADLAINYADEDFATKIKEFTKEAGVDVIFDWVSTNYFEKHLNLLKRNGRLVLLDSTTGDFANLDLGRLISFCRISSDKNYPERSEGSTM